jgi:hypothetical protein
MMTRYVVRKQIQPLMDALELDCEDTSDYYSLNHATPAQFCQLEDALVKWLESIGIKFVV